MAAKIWKDAAQVTDFCDNIMSKWYSTDNVLRNAGMSWYEGAHTDCKGLAARIGVDYRAVAGAAAAISPGMKWDLVLEYVDLIAQAGTKRRLGFNVPTYSKLFVDRARRCLRGEDPLSVLGGPKVTAFYKLLVDPCDAETVCVDSHAFNIALGVKTPIRGDQQARLTRHTYELVARAYRMAALVVGVLPHQMQAVTWVQHRAIDERQDTLPF